MKIFVCPYCFKQLECDIEAIQEHLAWPHYNHHFEEFQCLHCEMGYSDVGEIRQHMCQSHPSKLLFVGARWNFKPSEYDSDEIQIVYVGDSKDHSKYELYTCSNFDALNSMDPRELSPSKQFEKLIQIQNKKIRTKYHGRLPSISDTVTKELAERMFITFDEYQRRKSPQSFAISLNQSLGTSSSAHLKISENYQETSQSNATAAHDAITPLVQNSYRSDHFEDPNSKCSSVHKVSMISAAPSTSKIPATMPIQSSKDERVDDFTTDSDRNSTHQNQKTGRSHENTKFQATITSRMVTSPMHYSDQNSSDTNQSSEFMEPENSECSIHSEVSMNRTAPSASEPLHNDTTAAPVPASASPILSTQYICITNQMYNDLSAIEHETVRKSRPCCMPLCSESQTTENESGLQAYVEHLIYKHPCPFDEEITSLKEMLDHRLKSHGYEPLICLQIEEYESSREYKIVRYRNQECAGCKREPDVKDCTHDYDQSKVIVTDWKKSPYSMNSLREKFETQLVFMCDRHYPSLELGTKEEAVKHHNEEHNGETFRTSVHRFEHPHFGNDDAYEIPEHRAHLFECFYCKLVFASLLSHDEHICETKLTKYGPHLGPHFTTHKLVSCHKDQTIQTFQQMKDHYFFNHSNEVCTPIDIFNPNCCGLCDYLYTSVDDLKIHYLRSHKNGEIVTSQFLVSMEPHEFSLEECHFAPVCCPEFKTKGIAETIQRICQRHFTCNKCITMKFEKRIISLINHQVHVEKKTDKEVLEWLHKFKLASTLFSKMQITLPNGFTAALGSITDQNMVAEVQQKLDEKIIEISKIFQNESKLLTKNFIYFLPKFIENP